MSAVPQSPLLRDSPFFRTDKPYVRWWWFNEPIAEQDITSQLEWVSRSGFGGVEIAWVYPVPGTPAGPTWLGPAWAGLARHAKETCARLALGCDFTLGSLWPFGDPGLRPEHTSRWFTGPSPQRIDRHWVTRELPGGPAVMNHLDRRALEAYFHLTVGALAPAVAGETSCLFCDSWEVEEEGKLWTDGLGERFQDRFGYRIEPFMPVLGERPAERYDYRTLVSDIVLEEFFRPYRQQCRSAGCLSRVQCHGAPTDILAAYAEADVPESESILFDPGFSAIAASAAAITGKEIVSCEAFTCLYGWKPWPAASPRLGEEVIGDVKLLADELAANGVNRFVWHGMPLNPAGGRNRFYASVHVGPDGSLAPRTAELNRYLQLVSGFLRRGRPVHRIACLLPLEDTRMKGELPPALRKPSARYWWELQHLRFPRGLRPWSPMWVSGAFLSDAEALPGGGLRIGEAVVSALVLDCEFLEETALHHLARLSAAGARVITSREPVQPGRRESPGYARLRDALARGEGTRFAKDPASALADVPPLLVCPDGPDFCLREEGEDMLLFAAHPAGRALTYPMEYGTSARAAGESRLARLGGPDNREIDIELPFDPGGSVLLQVGRRGGAGRVDAPFAL